MCNFCHIFIVLSHNLNYQLLEFIYIFFIDINERPVFFASLTKDTTLSGVNDVVKFDDVKINVGRGYDRNTGVFTAPRNGVYVISCLILGRKSSEVHFQLNKNNDLYTGGYVSNINYGSNTLNSFLNLKKGDRVYIKHRINAVQNINGHHFSTFSGYLLSE